MAWEKWQFTAAEMARQQFMLAGALNRMLKRKMSQAWEKWQATYAEGKYLAHTMGGALTRWMNQKLSACFNKWKDALADARHQQYMMTQSLISWRLRQLQAEHKLRMGVKDAYPVEQWLPSALPHLNTPLKKLPALPAGNL